MESVDSGAERKEVGSRGKGLDIVISHFQRFLDEATVPDPEAAVLGPDCLYGLYVSWCLLHRIRPVEPSNAVSVSLRSLSVKR